MAYGFKYETWMIPIATAWNEVSFVHGVYPYISERTDVSLKKLEDKPLFGGMKDSDATENEEEKQEGSIAMRLNCSGSRH